MFKRTAIALASVLALSALGANAIAGADRDREFFSALQGQWTGPGEIVAGKYKGTKFVCNIQGATPAAKVGMTLDGTCRVGVFTQKMSATIERRGSGYRGAFLDGAKGKGLDVVSGNITGRKVVLSLVRNTLKGAMLARLSGDDAMNVTVSVRVDRKMVPVLGMSLKRVDGSATGAVASE